MEAAAHRTPLMLIHGAWLSARSWEPARTDYVEFAGRPHLHMVAPDWEEVAAGIDSWLAGVLESRAATVPQAPA